MLSKTVFLLAGAGFAAAQSISSQCSSTLVSVAGSPDSSCLNPNGIVQIVLTSSNSSVIPAVNSWLTGLCALGPCSNSSLEAVFTNLTSGCSSELASLGLTTNGSTNLTTYLVEAYPTLRQIGCLNDTSANELCVTEELTGVQNVTGTLTINNFITVAGQLISDSSSIPQSVTCSNCSKAAYTIADNNFPALVSNTTSTLQNTCGSSFTDGQTPSGIVETASNSSSSGSSSTGGAVSLSVNSLSMGVTMLVVVSSIFAIFA
ncbi:hypothetical protein EDD17DRAFT_1748597 [Pisolithus thermaeus]|nr:hypothetical protein EV401DRAFT_1897890 [Pisolithus croceorrhizus]KAI6169437.1 hypothetical protein EDD17DRAFT_1748597 [Pisolithus thermaeus]